MNRPVPACDKILPLYRIHSRNPTTLRTNTLGLRLDVGASFADYVRMLPRGSRVREARFIATFVNPASVIQARRDGALRQALDRFDLVMPDGIGICVAARYLHGTPVARASFDSTSLAPVVLEAAAREGNTIVLVGGRPGVVESAAAVLRGVFPSVRIIGTFDGYAPRDATLDAVRALVPDIVICGMGVSRQEQFLIALQACGWTGSGFTCGGYFDQLANGFSYFPAWIDAADLRWAYRLYREPRRLWRRYLLDYPRFIQVFIGSMVRQHMMATAKTSGD